MKRFAQGGFTSVFQRVGKVALPHFTGIRIMMMPVVIGNLSSVPSSLNDWKRTLSTLFSLSRGVDGQVGYLTIDERRVEPGETQIAEAI
jgi:hypothetical protein